MGLVLTAATVLLTGAATAADAPITVSDGGRIKKTADTAIVHFGYDGKGKAFTSGVLDGADPKAADPANYLPKKLVNAARTQRAGQRPLVCSLFVDKVTAHGLQHLKGITNQDCSGGFRNQWTQTQFAEDSGGKGWHRITGSIRGKVRTTAKNDSTFGLTCNKRPKKQHPYRLEARGYATADDGTKVKGYLEYGKDSKWKCR
nr:hypothetical protein [Streptomyces sp. SID4926]